jgi:hypothetical protein
MSGINTRRLMLAGLVAGILDNVLDGVIGAFFLSGDFNEILTRLNVEQGSLRSSAWIIIVGDLLYGFLLVFTYVAMRPRFGPGPKTAVISALSIWLVMVITLSFLLIIQLYSMSGFVRNALLYLVASIIVSIVGAAIYKE